jgi:hypothetical protein
MNSINTTHTTHTIHSIHSTYSTHLLFSELFYKLNYLAVFCIFPLSIALTKFNYKIKFIKCHCTEVLAESPR